MTTKLFVLLASTVILSACGNKGPLVMPQKPVPVEIQRAAVPAPTSLPEMTPEVAPEATPEVTPEPAPEAAPEAPSFPTDPASNPAPK